MYVLGVKGYLINSFIKRKKDNDLEFYGSITDKKFKIDVLVILEEGESITFEVGCFLQIVGDLQEFGNIILHEFCLLKLILYYNIF